MTDRELLELAAKAFGFGKENPSDNPHCWTASEYPKGSGKHGALWNYVGHADTAELWNPLEDDGDALRLAVKLELDFYNSCISVRAIHRDRNTGASVKCRGNNPQMDPNAATRRAIVRAAAEIGRDME